MSQPPYSVHVVLSVPAGSGRPAFQEEADEVARAALSALLARVPARRGSASASASVLPAPDGAVWEGELHGLGARVRRAGDELIAELRDPSHGEDEDAGWRATDDLDAMRCFEQALLSRLP